MNYAFVAILSSHVFHRMYFAFFRILCNCLREGYKEIAILVNATPSGAVHPEPVLDNSPTELEALFGSPTYIGLRALSSMGPSTHIETNDNTYSRIAL